MQICIFCFFFIKRNGSFLGSVRLSPQVSCYNKAIQTVGSHGVRAYRSDEPLRSNPMRSDCLNGVRAYRSDEPFDRKGQRKESKAMERTLAMFLKENPFDYDAEQLCRLKQEI